MNKTLTGLLFIGCALMTTATMANSHANHHQSNQNNHHAQAQHWKSGQYFPQHKRYAVVDHHKIRHLPQPGRDQHWYRVNQQYVLVNTHNHRIVRTHR